MSLLQTKIAILTDVAAAVQTAENMASAGVANGIALTGAQKMQAAIAIVSVLSPQAAAIFGPLESIIQAIYGLLKLFGLLQRPPVEPTAEA